MIVRNPGRESAVPGPPRSGRMKAEIRSTIEAKSRDRIRIYLESRESWPFARSLTNLTEETAHEYGDRFLIELIQNAYDAHPSHTTDGVVRIVLDEAETAHGVLYVGNSGHPFTPQNFDALSNIAQSDKVPGEGIGNKGIGFRSVLQICEAPQVFSTTSDWHSGEKPDGFCFGFAQESDLARLTSSAEEFNAVRQDLTRYLLPVAIDEPCGRVQELLDAGCVTVVRLPLKGQRALEAVREQLELATAEEAPLLLFLNRLASIEITRASEEGQESVRVERLREPASGLDLPPGISAEEVEVQGNRFLVFRHAIDATLVRQAVRESIDAGALGTSWSKWEADAEVAVAVACDTEELTPALFTFLPMGSGAPAPLHGFLNAPFYTKLARMDLDEDVPLNGFLLDRGADLCVAAHLALKASARPDRFAAACDLLTWDRGQLQRLRDAFMRAGSEFEKARVVPVLSRASEAAWATLEDAYVWEGADLEAMDARAIAVHADEAIVLPGLGSERTARLEELHKACFGNGMHPSGETIASWAEAVARALPRNPLDPDRWNAFYRDLARLFRHKDVSVLQGRRLLVDSRQRLLPAGPWDQDEDSKGQPRTAVFFPPRRKAELGPAEEDAVGDEEDIEVPTRLRRAITYLHGDIALTKQEGSRRTRSAVREFLERSRLVLPYRRSALVAHVSQLLARARGDGTHREALIWAFRQFEATEGEVRDLRELPLRVPTTGGWILASTAAFGRGWPGTLGNELADLATALSGREAYARDLEDRLVLPPEGWLSEGAQPSDWARFLRSIGVRDGLFPLALRRRRLEMEGRFYSATNVAAKFELPPAIADQWEAAVAEGGAEVSHPYTPYRVRGEVWVLPGQHSYPELDRRTRELLAGLLLESLGSWPQECLEFTFERFRSADHRRYPDTQTWPSPAWAFACVGSWVPMADPRRRADTYFTEVARAWHHDDSRRETAPRFARLLPAEFRRRIQRSADSLRRLTDAGLRTWNDPSSARARLAECADLIVGGHLTEGDAAGVRRACRDAWHDLMGTEDGVGEDDLYSLPLVVSRGHSLAVVGNDNESEEPARIFVPTATRGIVSQVLESLAANILEIEAQDGSKVRDLLGDRDDVAIVPVSDVEARYIADGQIVDPESDRPLLIEGEDSWLVDVLLVVLDLQGSSFVRVTEQTLRRAAEKLRRVRIWRASTIDVEIDGESVKLPGHGGQSIALDDAERPLIVATFAGQDLSWEALESLASPLSEILGNRAAAHEIALASVRLGRVLDRAWRRPSADELAEALELPPERVADSLAGLRQGLASTIEHVAAVVAHFEGVEAGRHLLGESIEAEEALLKAIEGIPTLPVPAPELVRIASTAGDVGEVRRALEIDFAGFNRTLLALGSPYRSIADPERHEQALRHFITANRKQILDSLRERFLEDFRAGKALNDYVALSRLDRFAVPEEWPETYESPSEALLGEYIDRWLESHGAPALGACTAELEDVDELRRRNESRLGSVLTRLGNLVTAWCSQNGVEVPPGWFADAEEDATPRAYVRASGCLDFVAVEDEPVISWLAEGSFWPSGMPQTADFEALGLSEDVLDQEKRERRAREEEARRASRSVILDGEQLDASEEHYAELAAKTQASVDGRFLETSKRQAHLAEMAPRETGSRGGGRRGKARREPLTKEQRGAVGLVGEVLAYAWLRARYPSEVTPDSWVSGYRSAVLGGHEGDDSLGYDFEVVQRSQTLHFEVKATSTDTCEFQLTESELRAAQAARRGTYRILFIRNVLDKTRRTLHVLPNPFEETSRGKFRVMNEGLRYRFDLETEGSG